MARISAKSGWYAYYPNLTYDVGSSGSFSNVISSNRLLLDIKSDIQLEDSVFLDSAMPTIQQEGTAPRFSRVNFLNAGPYIAGNTYPVFESGVWSNANWPGDDCTHQYMLDYYPGYQPKPVFTDIEMFDRWQVPAYSVWGTITDHVTLSGLNFIPCITLQVDPAGWLEIKDATLVISQYSSRLNAYGRLDLEPQTSLRLCGTPS